MCKTGNAGGSFTFVREQFGHATLLGYIFTIIPTFSLAVGVCMVVAEDNGRDGMSARC